MGAPPGVSGPQSGLHHAGAGGGRLSRRFPAPAIIAEYLDETRGAELGEQRLLPREPGPRVEVRRLMSWFNDKFFAEVSGPLTMERLYKRHMPVSAGGGSPDTDGDPCGAPQHAISSGLYRLAGAHARLAGRRRG